MLSKAGTKENADSAMSLKQKEPIIYQLRYWRCSDTGKAWIGIGSMMSVICRLFEIGGLQLNGAS